VIAEVPVETAVEIEAHAELYPGTRVNIFDAANLSAGGHRPHLVGYRTPIDALL